MTETTELRTFRDVMAQWPTVADMARDLDVPEPTVRSWWQRKADTDFPGSIPGDWWVTIAAAAKRAKINGVTVGLLAEIAHHQRLARI